VKYFIDESQQPSDDNIHLNFTPGYVEVETHNINPAFVLYCYVFRWDESSLLVAAHPGFDEYFNTLLQQLQHPKLGRAYFDFAKETWPISTSVFEHALNGQYSLGALINIEDPDTNDRTWIVGTIVGNISLGTTEETEKVLRSERVGEAAALVVQLSAAIGEEARTKKVSKMSYAKLALQGAWSGYKEGLDTSAVWANRLTGLVGPFYNRG
jgi:hypothetical protein